MFFFSNKFDVFFRSFSSGNFSAHCCLTDAEVEKKWKHFRIWLACTPLVVSLYLLVGHLGDRLSHNLNADNLWLNDCLAVVLFALLSFFVYSLYSIFTTDKSGKSETACEKSEDNTEKKTSGKLWTVGSCAHRFLGDFSFCRCGNYIFISHHGT